MTITGKVIGFEDGFHSIEIFRNKEIKKVKLTEQYDYGTYLSLDIVDNTAISVHQLSIYKTLPFKEIINSNTHEDHEIEFIKPFKITSCMSKEEAELEFAELLKNSSCNFVQNLTYIQNDENQTYEVTGDIGLYSLTQVCESTLSAKFSKDFDSNVKTVYQNLQIELEKIMNQEDLKVMFNNASIWLVAIFMIMVIIQGLYKYF